MWKDILKKFGNCWKSTSDTVNNDMMTLRETIDHVLSRGAQAHVHACIYNVYYRTKDKTFPEVMDAYGNVLKELQDLPSNNDTEFHIVLQDQVINEEQFVDVHLCNTTDNESFAVDFIDWGDLIDLLVEDRVGMSQADQVAHILYELTFWGFTGDQVKRERRLMEIASEDANQVIDILDIDDLLDQD